MQLKKIFLFLAKILENKLPSDSSLFPLFEFVYTTFSFRETLLIISLNKSGSNFCELFTFTPDCWWCANCDSFCKSVNHKIQTSIAFNEMCTCSANCLKSKSSCFFSYFHVMCAGEKTIKQFLFQLNGIVDFEAHAIYTQFKCAAM